MGGQKLSSTGASDPKDPLKVYPPGAAVSFAAGGGGTSVGVKMEVEESGAKEEGGAGGGEKNTAGGSEEVEPEAVGELIPLLLCQMSAATVNLPPPGEELVLAVRGDPSFPHARFKCTMCDCYFNDEYAKKAHVKGRRHRLNYKKMYKPDLYVEPTKQQKKQIESRKKMFEQRQFEQRKNAKRSPGGMMMERGAGASPGGPMDVNELRRLEAAELAKMYHRVSVHCVSPPLSVCVGCCVLHALC